MIPAENVEVPDGWYADVNVTYSSKGWSWKVRLYRGQRFWEERESQGFESSRQVALNTARERARSLLREAASEGVAERQPITFRMTEQDLKDDLG